MVKAKGGKGGKGVYRPKVTLVAHIKANKDGKPRKKSGQQASY